MAPSQMLRVMHKIDPTVGLDVFKRYVPVHSTVDLPLSSPQPLTYGAFLIDHF